ncbi:hypothetical protein L9F63_002401, partial [Diploptera punctata]
LTNVWDGASQFIRKNLQHGRGVKIKDLGTFTFSEWTTNIGSKTIENKQPTFLMSEKLVKFYNLKTRVLYTTGKTPVVALNFATIAASMVTCRQMVEDCVTEITEAFLRLLSHNEDVEIPFSNIGHFQIKNKHVIMNFKPNFLKNDKTLQTSETKMADEFKGDDPLYTSSPVVEEETVQCDPCEPQLV